jgi:hypothetical protein
MHQTFPKFAEGKSRVELAAERKATAEKLWRDVCKLVDLRDGKACRCCDKRSDPEATGLLTRGHRHHLVYRSAGGKDVSDNLCTLCSRCHADEHTGKLRIEGNPDVSLMFYRKDDAGAWYVVREEIAVRQVRKD